MLLPVCTGAETEALRTISDGSPLIDAGTAASAALRLTTRRGSLSGLGSAAANSPSGGKEVSLDPSTDEEDGEPERDAQTVRIHNRAGCQIVLYFDNLRLYSRTKLGVIAASASHKVNVPIGHAVSAFEEASTTKGVGRHLWQLLVDSGTPLDVYVATPETAGDADDSKDHATEELLSPSTGALPGPSHEEQQPHAFRTLPRLLASVVEQEPPLDALQGILHLLGHPVSLTPRQQSTKFCASDTPVFLRQHPVPTSTAGASLRRVWRLAARADSSSLCPCCAMNINAYRL